MKANVFLVVSFSVVLLFSPGFCSDSVASNGNILMVNQQSIQRGIRELPASEKSVAIKSDNLGTLKQERMRARAKTRALGAEERRNRLMEARERRKKAVEEQRTLLAQKKIEYAKMRKNEPSNVQVKKPAAPKNTMLGVQNKQPIVLKSPIAQVKKI